MQPYNPADIAIDATKFSQDRFGQHYVNEVLGKEYAQHIDVAVNGKTREERADAGLKASVVKSHMDYFTIAQNITKSPSLMAKLRKKFKERMNLDS